MLVISWRGWPKAAVAAGALLAFAACAPNAARTPMQPRVKPGVAVAIVRDCLAAMAALHREGLVRWSRAGLRPTSCSAIR